MKNNILIIENDKDILVVLENILTYNKFGVSGIEKTDDIFESVQKYQPDLIITDYLLSGINGGKICQLIKSNPQTSKIPVILISAYNDLAMSMGTYGFDAFINKPFNINTLLKTINDCLDKTQL
jgi:two-component system phosphate regulon response regulator PhoB